MSRKWFSIAALIITASLLLSVSSCGDPQELVGITVQPGSVTFGASNIPVPADAGLTTQLTALGTYVHPPVTKDITNQVTWASSDDQEVTVSSTGLIKVTGVVCGPNALISATLTTNADGSGLSSSGAVVTGSMTASVVCFTNTSGGFNAADGIWALYSNTTGSGNAASGDSALYFNTTGGNNAALGAAALYYNTTGGGNTAVGYGAGPDSNSPSLSNSTAIGNAAVVSESNALVLGCINGVNSCPGTVNVGIGTAKPAYILQIAKGLGSAWADGWSTYSSRRWKTNIHTLQGALAKVEQLRGVSYDLKDSGKHEIGVIAEEAGAVVPEVVTWEKNGTDAQSVDYGRLTALLIEGMKEQQALIQQQQQQIRVQQAQMKVQQAEITRLSSQVQAIRASLNTSRTESAIRTVKAEVPTVHQ